MKLGRVTKGLKINNSHRIKDFRNMCFADSLTISFIWIVPFIHIHTSHFFPGSRPPPSPPFCPLLLKKSLFYKYFRCMVALPACMFVPCVCTWCLWRPEEGIGFPRTGFAGSCEASCGFWEFNLGPLEEQLVILITKHCFMPLPILVLFLFCFDSFCLSQWISIVLPVGMLTDYTCWLELMQILCGKRL